MYQTVSSSTPGRTRTGSVTERRIYLRRGDWEQRTTEWTKTGRGPSGPVQSRTRSVRWLDWRVTLWVIEDMMEVKKPYLSTNCRLVDMFANTESIVTGSGVFGIFPFNILLTTTKVLMFLKIYVLYTNT